MRNLALLLLSLLLIPATHAADTVAVTDAWVRLPPPGAQIAAAYLTLSSKQTISMSSVTSPLAEAVEIHTMSMHNGMMKMRQLPALKIEANKPVKLEPGGLHLMLINPKPALKEGDTVPLELHFKQGKREIAAVKVQAMVKSPAH